nr:hypothetical protein [Tanacetum cinerariifolium]
HHPRLGKTTNGTRRVVRTGATKLCFNTNHIHFANAVSRNDQSMYMLPTSASIRKQRTMHKSQYDTTGTNVTRMSNAQPNSPPNHGNALTRYPKEYQRNMYDWENIRVHANTVVRYSGTLNQS